MNAAFILPFPAAHIEPGRHEWIVPKGIPSVDFHQLLDELLEREAELLRLDLFSHERRLALARVESLMDRILEAGRPDHRQRPIMRILPTW